MAATFLVLGLARIASHEMWRDELASWVAARDAVSVDALVSRLANRGHPFLWDFVLFVLSRVTTAPEAMQALHVAVAAAAVGLVVAFAPGTPARRVLFALGYFPFYEYAIVSRAYGLGLLLGAGVCAFRARRPGVALLCLCLLMQTSAYGALLALALAVGWAIEAAPSALPGRRGALLAGLALTGAALLVAVLQIAPVSIGWQPAQRPEALAAVAGTLLEGHLPLPEPIVEFWNTHLLRELPWLEAGLALLVLGAGVVLLRGSRAALGLFLTGHLLLLGVGATIGPGFARHHGHFLLVTLAAAWFAGSAGRGSLALSALLVAQVPAGLFASLQDVRLPFSQSRATARYVEALGGSSLPIVADRTFPAAAVSLWLGRSFYYPATGRFDNRGFWRAPRRRLAPNEILAAGRELATQSRTDVLLVLSYPLPRGKPAERLASLAPSIVASESFWIYRLRRSSP